jgi:uncharacterized membrane protein YvlD (DUF360 family)
MRITGHSVYLLVRRVLLVWAVEGLALWSLAQVLPGLRLEGWRAAVWGVAAIALLNALVRPLLLLLTLPFTVLSFGFLTIALNAFILILAARAVPGLSLTNPVSAVVAALGLAAVNTFIASVLALNDEDSFYRNVVKRIVRRAGPPPGEATPALVMIEIDGLSAPVLAHAMRDGYMPHLKRWLDEGSHRMSEWDCGLPSQTSSSQAGILYGNNFDIPAFRWYDKQRGELVVSNLPADAMRIEQQISTGDGLLKDNGVSIGNMFTGGAPRWVATLSTYHRDERVRQTSPMFFNYFINPYNFTRAIVLMLWEVVVEWWEALRQRMKNVQPRVSRGGSFPLLRAGSTVFTRELNAYLLMAEMFSGISVAYTTFVGYDVVAHHAGPFRLDALRILRDLDRRIHVLWRAAKDAPRPYHFVLLSDHGQSHGTPFRLLYNTTLEELVRSLVGEERSVHASIGENEGRGWGHINVLLSEAIQYERAAGRAARRFLRGRTRKGFVELGDKRSGPTGDANVVVCASGNLGLIYFTGEPGRVSFESIASNHPRLIEGLVEHPGIDFVMARSAEHGALVIGKNGVRYLAENRVRGIDPLGHLGENAVEHVRVLDSYPHSGDLVVNGRCDPATGDVVAFEDLVGSHGGLGGPQTQPFIVHPAAWSTGDGPIRNANELHAVLRRWRDALAAKTPVAEQATPQG